ncbi:PREDICTED: membrane alanyl aminopeptidase [Drosophila arizonae]|uniref:Aminopeptidase n=1 Tax=Drosophila arizonae TaxID=7263 RepID=A0ABM1Q1N6_DROAR|nr:PREDICTED: membrane alanyl aminopeptidase [Drosophila arizonae]
MFSLGRSVWLLAGLLSIGLIAGVECTNYRLERTVLPVFYNLTIGLRVDANQPSDSFDGAVDIILKATQPNVNAIVLHKEDIDIAEVALYNDIGSLLYRIANSSLTYSLATQKLTVQLLQPLSPNANFTLHFKYRGKVNSDMKGLFSASYVEQETGLTKWMVLTQLQRIYARLLFPCFDEPAFKARFQLHIERPSGLHAISNTQLIATTELRNNRSMDHFQVTPFMSTYLLAFMVAESQARGNLSDLAVVSRPQDYSNSEFSYNVAQRARDAYDKLFQHPYKELGNEALLHAASPRFPHNGMENWGLIIYSKNILVHRPNYTDGWNDKETSIRIIVHETSHMWFGDSVTFAWWNNFWLNEAFARYYEYFMSHQLYPAYQLDEQFVVRQLQMIFTLDANNGTQPLSSREADIRSPSEIASKFSSITYAKGSSIVRMWRNAMGAENFDLAIRNYLRQHHLGNTVPKDLFTHLKAHWPKPLNADLDQFFYDFTEQVGYPIVEVNRVDSSSFTLRQRRYMLDPNDGSDRYLTYTVPITYTTNVWRDFENLAPVAYFNKWDDTMLLPFSVPIEWIVLNLQQSNYYRVQYAPSLLRRIHEALIESNHSDIHVANRAAIIDDLFNLALIGLNNYAEVFEFMEYMSTETEYIPWYAAYVGMDKVAMRLTPDQLPNFKKYLIDITDGVYAKLGVRWASNDTVLDVYNRNKMVSWLCKYHHFKCEDEVKESFDKSTEIPSPDYRETYYCAASRGGRYLRIMEYYRNETDPTERELLWRAASCTRDFYRHYHDEILNESSSVSLKTVGLAQLYRQNPDLVTSIFIAVTTDIQQLADALQSWPKTATALSDMAEYFTTRYQQQLFAEFINESSMLFGSSDEILRQALLKVEKNIKWAELNLDQLVRYLATRNGAADLKLMSALLLVVTSLLNFWLT